MTDKSLQGIEEMAHAKYINPCLKVYRDLKNVLHTAELRGLKKGLTEEEVAGLED